MNILFILLATAGTLLLIRKTAQLLDRLTECPMLEIRIIPGKGKAHLKWSNTRNKDRQLLYTYEITWCYHLQITNTSDFPAYYPKLTTDRTLPHDSRITVLNHYVPISPKETVTLYAEYTILEECSQEVHNLPEGIPQALQHIIFQLRYQNRKKKQFYTLFDVSTQLNTRYFFRPF